VDVEQYRTASREQWQGSAEGWGRHAERVDESAKPATEWMLDASVLEPGATVLELGCGPAGVGVQAAERVAPGGRVICSDFADSMVDVARERARGLGVENMDFRVLDAEALDLPDEAVDAVVCRFGYMLMADPAQAFSETLRVLRPGGRLALAVWRGPEENPWLALPMRTLMDHLEAPPPEPDAPGVFSLSDEGRLRSLLEGAGFAEVRTETVSAVQWFDSFEDYWTTTRELAAPLRAMLEGMDESGRAAVTERLRDSAARFEQDGGLDFPAAALVAVGRRP
jgi:SAM-dependent methyltransferase